MSPWRRTLAACVVAAAAAMFPAAAWAVLAWTLVGMPLSATANQSTTFTLTATNLDLIFELGCLEVDLPGAFVVEGVGTPTASNDDPWAATHSAGTVVVRSETGGGRLETGDWVRFTIRARPTAAGEYLWPNHAHQRQDCTGADEVGVPLAISVLPEPEPTPSPTPSPTPTPTPTPMPSLPLPSLPLPSLSLATATPTPTPRASATPSPASSSVPSAAPSAIGGTGSDAARPSPVPGTASLPPLPPAPGAGAGTGAIRLAPEAATGPDDLFGGFGIVTVGGDPFVWFVPAAAVGVPGLLLIAWVALQAAGAMAWIPAVRRMRGDDRRGSRPGGLRG